MLVSIDEARAHVKADFDLGPEAERDLLVKVHAASESILSYIKAAPFVEGGYPYPFIVAGAIDLEDVPFLIQSAVLILFGYLWKNRDHDEDKEFDGNNLPRPVTALLYAYRTPTLA